MWLFYAPFIPYWLWNSLMSGSFTYFCKVNPGMKFGGFLDYSKFEILQQIPQEFIPRTYYIKNKNEIKKIVPNGEDLSRAFPFVIKPDLGERGVNVEVIRNQSDWRNYSLEKDLIVQEFLDLPLEFGVFYAKLPHENSGKIISITGKNFLQFESDGISTLRDFIEKNTRAYFRKDYLFKKFENQLDIIYPKGTEILLEPIGNHNRGTMFYDASHLISDRLAEKINEISNQINGFNYGRFDVKSKSTEDFQNGNFIILEINGANSEATHIYDEKYNLLQAYREVKRHLDIQFQIAKMNRKNYSDKEFYMAIWKRIK